MNLKALSCPNCGANYNRRKIPVRILRQLKQLLDMGIITEDEFNIKKRMLLGL